MTEYRIIYSRRRTVALEITKECEVVVRAPKGFSKKAAEGFVLSHESWIKKGLEKKRAQKEREVALSDDAIREMKKSAAERLIPRVEYFSALTGLTPSGVKITKAKTRYGSCSAKNSLCFSCRLMFSPEEAADYVVLHEIAHIKYKNHSKDFYRFISQYMPDYKERAKKLTMS